MRRTVRAALVFSFATLSTTCTIEPNPVPDAPAILFDDDSTSRTFGAVDVVGLSSRTLGQLEKRQVSEDDWRRILLVQTDTGGADQNPIVGGEYSIVEERVRFTPQYAPVRGAAYRVRFDLRELRRLTGTRQDTMGVLDTTVVAGRN